MNTPQPRRAPGRRAQCRSGTIAVLSAFLLVVVVLCVAFAVDIGYICLVRTQAQACADSAALAAAWELIGEERLYGDEQTIITNARNKASEFAALNRVGTVYPLLRKNFYNQDKNGDVIVGRLATPWDPSDTLTFGDASTYNTVVVRIRATQNRDQQSPFFFARVMGLRTFDVEAEATASFIDSIVGFRVTNNSGNAKLLPFAVDINDWQDMLAGNGDDLWEYDPQTGDVRAGTDFILEMNMFPTTNGGPGGVTPGNFGTVAIGDADLSNADLQRQIRDGVNKDDMAYHGGELSLSKETGTLVLKGDTGIDSSLQLSLDDVIGQARVIPLYNKVISPGATAEYTIVGFAGIRVVDVNLRGASMYVRIQPSFVTDKTALPGVTPDTYFVGQPVHLVR